MPLILVATPIGNLGDLPPRAAAALAEADVICCEDTRRTGRLLQLAGIERTARLVRVDDHTEAAKVEPVLARLAAGERVVVVTDAGTPGIADPGEVLVRAALDAGLPVEVVPGPSAAVTALVVSGLPAGRFVFEGFLPRKGAARAERLAELAGERRTIVLYESPHRAAATLADLARVLGEGRQVAVGRELTKLHEEVRRSTLAEAADWAAAKEPIGELVFVVDGAPAGGGLGVRRRGGGAVAFADGMSAKDAAAKVAAELGVPEARPTTPPSAHAEQPGADAGPGAGGGERVVVEADRLLVLGFAGGVDLEDDLLGVLQVEDLLQAEGDAGHDRPGAQGPRPPRCGADGTATGGAVDAALGQVVVQGIAHRDRLRARSRGRRGCGRLGGCTTW